MLFWDGDAADKTEVNKRRKYDNIISKDSHQQCNLFIFAVETSEGLPKHGLYRRMGKLAEDPIHATLVIC
jgi:hypothetical protein